jgi:Holliday junction resolvasome RuvABC ATP-dependent DNA helicase subunit
MTADEARAYVDPENGYNPLSKFIGNKKALRILARAAFAAMQREDHCCGDFSFSIIGPPSTGKTTLVELFAEMVGLPLVVIQPQRISCVNDILYEIAQVCDHTKIGDDTMELDTIEGEDRTFRLPPMIVFIDEVHALKNNVVQGLLKATEPKDRTLVTEEEWTAFCDRICWIVATTDRGLLFDAFDTRFTKIPLSMYTTEEVAQIVRLNFPDWDEETCLKIARVGGRIPREVIEFAKQVKLESEMSPKDDLEEVLGTVREEFGIDQYGMTYQRVQILKVLGQGPIAKNRLGFDANCKPEELERYVMPPLLIATNDQPAMVSVGSKGYEITPAGLAELEKRNIAHKGEEAMA